MSQNKNVDIVLAGAFAAFTVDLVVYPLDTIKTRLQSADYKKYYRHGSRTGFSPSLFRGLYQGVGSVIIATLPSSGAFFTTYEGVKHILHAHNPHDSSSTPLLPTPLLHAAASGTAELVSCAILTPAEVIKQNAQMVDNGGHRSGQPRFNATWTTLARFRSQPWALWRGYAALAGRNLPFTAMQFPLFERIRQAIRRHRDERGTRTHTLLESGVITAVSAGAGGGIAAVITTPIDVVKTRVMLAAAEDGGKVGAKAEGNGKTLLDAVGQSVKNAGQAAKDVVTQPTRTTSMQIAREIVREHGVKGLFRGGALRGVWTILGSGLYLGVYESGRLYLARRRGESLDAEDLE